MSRSCPNKTTSDIPKNVAHIALGFFIFLVTLTLVVHLTCSHAYAAQVTLAWDPITDSDVSGYKLYFGTVSGNYTQNIDVGTGSYDGASVSYTVTNLPDGLYYFVATGYDSYGNESNYSNEVSDELSSVQQYALIVNKSGSGAGDVTGPGISCGTGCNASYNTPTFSSWAATRCWQRK